VYRVSADLGTMTLLMDSLTDHIVQPNGLAFSPDESVLYIIDSRRGQIRAFDVLANGMLAKQTDASSPTCGAVNRAAQTA
jgi:gluconolactonase